MKATTLLYLVAFLLSTPLVANTYSIQVLDSDAGRSFYGMDDFGHVVFLRDDPFVCGSSASVCYETISGGSAFAYSTEVPQFDWDYVKGICSFPQPASAPCSISNNGKTAVIANSMTLEYGPNLSQVLHGSGFGGVFAINGVGDIVFDDQWGDLWTEIIDPPDPPSVPEPSSILLMGIGVVAATSLLRRRVSV